MTPALPQSMGIRPAGTSWIISRRDDLLWFIGPAAISYLALSMLAAGFPLTPIYLTWFLFIDGPHVMGTVTRTYLDTRERKRLGWFLWIIVPFLLMGPAMVWAGQASLFYLFAVCWQHYHIAKQHMGFMMLWKAKNKERDPVDLKLDRWFLLSSTVLPLALFVVKTRLMGFRPAEFLSWAATAAYAIFAVIYLAHQVKKFRAGLPLNAPKLILLAVLVPLQWIAFLYAARFGPDGILRAGIVLGLFHSLQYHRLLWFHNRNRYSTPGAGNSTVWQPTLPKILVTTFSLLWGCTLRSMSCPRLISRPFNGCKPLSGVSRSRTTCSIPKSGECVATRNWPPRCEFDLDRRAV